LTLLIGLEPTNLLHSRLARLP